MQLSDVRSLSSSTNLKSSGAPSAAAQSKDLFLKLLFAQLKNQDPLQPPDASKFADQLTQFGQLEQLINLNDGMSSLQQTQDSLERSQAVGLIGKKVEALDNSIEVERGKASDIGYSLESGAEKVEIKITNFLGKVVRTIHLDAQSAGSHFQPFDGKDEAGVALPEGIYKAEIQARGADGSLGKATPILQGLVTGVDFIGGQMRLRVGNRLLEMNQVMSVKG